MTAIDRELSERDGLWWFNHLYLRVTLAVRRRGDHDDVSRPGIPRAARCRVCESVFRRGRRRAMPIRGRAPSAWRPLFECRHQRGILSIQFALAGMNAHINRDLPAGIVATYLAIGGAPNAGGARHDDFDKVNDLLEAVEAEIKVSSPPVSWRSIDAAGGEADDAVAMWKVRAARETGVDECGGAVGAAARTPPLRDAFFSRLDSFTGFAGRGSARAGCRCAHAGDA